MTHAPILWSFRRCPYAMRARLAISAAQLPVELREIKLREKPTAFLAASPSATVPCLQNGAQTIDESLDIMVWALEQSDPLDLLQMPDVGWDLIRDNDGPFKTALDHTKYQSRYPDLDPTAERATAMVYLNALEAQLATGKGQTWLFGPNPSLADFAILPFVRQFAYIDRRWFDAQGWPHLIAWLDRFLDSDLFLRIMPKLTPWSEGNAAQRVPL